MGRIQNAQAGGQEVLGQEFFETLREELQASAELRRAVLRESVGCIVSGDVETGKSVLKRYIAGTVGFSRLAVDLGRSPAALMRMFNPSGNPNVRDLFAVVAYLQKQEGTVLEVVDHAA